jgi:hypothetical protein
MLLSRHTKRREFITLLGGAAARAQDYPSRASTFSAMQATLQYERNPL